MTDDHPWRRAGRREIRLAPLDGLLGAYDPDTGIIWISHGLTQAERRSTLAHELAHAERGDEACCTPWHEAKQERVVDEVAARALISLDRLAEALRWAVDERELAEELWVDTDTVRTRLDRLSVVERDYIEDRLWAEERGA